MCVRVLACLFVQTDKGDEDDEEGVERPPKFSEVHRLAYTVDRIDNDTCVIPKGYILIDATRTLRVNRSFGGLNFSEAGSLDNYQHLRASSTADMDSGSIGVKASDFLDRLSDDEPRGVWALRTDPSTQSASLRSLQWPGYFFYMKAGSSDFAGTYTGNGLPNGDIGFML